MSDSRVVSLLPSATEIVCSLGAHASLVGRSHECDYPADVVAGLPACTRVNIRDGTSREIDDRVAELLDKSLSLYDVDVETLRRVAPDLVITQDQCEVCAASLTDVEAALADWTGRPVSVISLSPSVLGDVFDDIRRVGEVLDLADHARSVALQLEQRASEIGERAGELGRRPSVLCLEWIDPLMSAGNWTPELVTLAGGKSLGSEVGKHSPRMSWDDLSASDPDVIVVTACGFDLARTQAELGPLVSNPRWRELRAVREGRVYTTDGNAFFNRSGPRLVESIEILAEILHPEHFEFGHRAGGWDVVA